MSEASNEPEPKASTTVPAPIRLSESDRLLRALLTGPFPEDQRKAYEALKEAIEDRIRGKLGHDPSQILGQEQLCSPPTRFVLPRSSPAYDAGQELLQLYGVWLRVGDLETAQPKPLVDLLWERFQDTYRILPLLEAVQGEPAHLRCQTAEEAKIRAEVATRVLHCLTSALHADPSAICALMHHYVPANAALTAHPYVVVEELPGYDGYFRVSALGLLNGLLAAAGLPRIAARLSGEDPALLGFQFYDPQPAVAVREQPEEIPSGQEESTHDAPGGDAPCGEAPPSL